MTNQFDLQSLRGRLLLGSSVSEAERGPPVAAVAVIISPGDRGDSVLMIRRTEREGDPWSGQMAFPGGHKSPKDRDFLETAIRETREEVGIHLHKHELLGHLPPVTARSVRVQVAPFVFQLKSTVTVRTNDEVAESFWVPLAELQKLEVSKREVKTEEGILTADAYVYNGHMIWGLTRRIINILLNRKFESDL